MAVRGTRKYPDVNLSKQIMTQTNTNHTDHLPARPNRTNHPEGKCPCGSGLLFCNCCQPILSGRSEARSAEKLARARHTAHATDNAQFLMSIQEPATRDTVDWDKYQADLDTMKWLRFDILNCAIKEDMATITSSVTCKKQGSVYRYQEEGRYTREKGQWYFSEGEITELKKICPCDKCHCFGCF